MGGSNQIDITRMAAQVISGIGFLGAGAIIRSGSNVSGLTTAASLWVMAAVGLAIGSGYWQAALLTTGIMLFGLLIARGITEYINKRRKSQGQSHE